MGKDISEFIDHSVFNKADMDIFFRDLQIPKELLFKKFSSEYVKPWSAATPSITEWSDKLNRRNTMHEVKIKKANRGYIVRVGCQTLVFERLADVNNAIEEYFLDPDAAEKKYCDKVGEAS